MMKGQKIPKKCRSVEPLADANAQPYLVPDPANPMTLTEVPPVFSASSRRSAGRGIGSVGYGLLIRMDSIGDTVEIDEIEVQLMRKIAEYRRPFEKWPMSWRNIADTLNALGTFPTRSGRPWTADNVRNSFRRFRDRLRVFESNQKGVGEC